MVNDCSTCKFSDLDLKLEPCKTCLKITMEFRGQFTMWIPKDESLKAALK